MSSTSELPRCRLCLSTSNPCHRLSCCAQDLALQQLGVLAEGRSDALSAMRAELWADETGRRVWGPLVAFLLSELKETTAALAAALPATASAGAC